MRSAASLSSTDGQQRAGGDDARRPAPTRRRRTGRRTPAGSASKASRRRTASARSAGSRGAAAVDGQPEPVEQLRAQLALLRVHRADQQEPGRVPHRDALALDVAGAQRRRVEQQVDQVVVQQVDLVDVEHAAVRGGEQAGLVGRDALGQRALEVERAGEPVVAGARPAARPAGPDGRRRGRAGACGPSGQDGSGAAGSQENRQPATTSSGGSTAVSARTVVDLALPFSPRTSTPPIAGRHRVEDEREPHVVHADDRR